MGQQIGQFTIIGKQDQTLAIHIQSPYRVQAHGCLYQIIKCPATPVILHRRQNTPRLVEHEVGLSRDDPDPLAIHPDLVPTWIHLGTELGDCPAIDRHPALPDQLFCLSARSHTSMGQNLL
jgi:hypothetical protein